MESHNQTAAQAGALDPDFANAGLQTLRFPGYAQTTAMGIALTPSGLIMVSVTLRDASGRAYYGLTRLSDNGTVDVSFGEEGYISRQYTSEIPSHGGELIIDANGGMLMCGFMNASAGNYQLVIAKFNPNGSPNLSFGNQNGYIIVPMRTPDFYNASSGRISFAQSKPGSGVRDRILFVTSKNGKGLIARFDLNGIEDLEFSEGWVLVSVDGLCRTSLDFRTDESLRMEILLFRNKAL
jgi:hypothetical protein